MEEAEKLALVEAVLSGLLKWEIRRIQEYEQFDGPPSEKEALRSERRLETMFMLRRGLHVGYYQIIARELAKDRRWDDQRADLLREAIQTLVAPTGTFEPGHHAKEPKTKSRRITARHHQKRYHEHFPEFFFEPTTTPDQRGRDKRFKTLSTVFSPLDVPGYAPAQSPFFVLDPLRVATTRFIWTAQTVPGTTDFADDLLNFRNIVKRTIQTIPTESNAAEQRKQLIHDWLTTYGMISVAFRAQVAAIVSVQWFRRQTPDRRRDLIGIPCPRDDTAMDADRITKAYESLGLSARNIATILTTASQAVHASDAWSKEAEESATKGLDRIPTGESASNT